MWSFCAHAINNPKELFEIPDAKKDVRFAGNPLVENGTVGFYAGVPLIFHDENNQDVVLGAFCIIDSKPR